MPWHAQLQIDYCAEASRTVARYQHTGPLRILKSLYPEGDAICHNVLVHPPGGLVGGDTLDIHVHAASGTHGLITTPGATRFYRSQGDRAVQKSRITLEEGARLEWLPLENIAYSGCLAENRLQLNLTGGAELIGWDVTALGLPNANLPFEQGRFLQHIEMPGVWLERGHIDATDLRLMDSPLGLAGHRCTASLFFAAGSPIERNRKQRVLDAARDVMASHDLRGTAGVTSPNPQVIVLRVVAPLVESAMHGLRQVWAVWRSLLWDTSASSPRIWST
ncbi:MAG TPA: urease accessory protein UreD [Burkholderiaceae bacterium]|nr:urease accessory protein UreD [Burkholderiaceae bacterium]